MERARRRGQEERPGPPLRRRKKPANRYHHGDLPRALLEEALRMIQTHGVDGLTLRAIGERLGVSRTALYRHFADKQTLLAAVGREGFRMLRIALGDAWQQHGRGSAAFEAMGMAYVQFAVGHPAHYRVMFGGFLDSCDRDEAFNAEARGAFDVLVHALVAQQEQGTVRRDDPVTLAQFVWAVVHGTAMLAIDGQLGGIDDRVERLTRYALDRLRAAIATTPS